MEWEDRIVIEVPPLDFTHKVGEIYKFKPSSFTSKWEKEGYLVDQEGHIIEKRLTRQAPKQLTIF